MVYGLNFMKCVCTGHCYSHIKYFIVGIDTKMAIEFDALQYTLT